jgi:hypothetical protein
MGLWLMVERMLADYEMAYGIAVLLYAISMLLVRIRWRVGECRIVETHLIPLMLDNFE